MQKEFERDYPETVYENAWEDLMVIRESWKSVHGVDEQFCVELINEFANYINNDIINKADSKQCQSKKFDHRRQPTNQDPREYQGL